MSDKHEEADSKAKPAEAGAPAGGGGGIKSMLPLIVSIVLMPVLAYVMTSFVLLPKLKASAGATAGAAEAKTDAHGEEAKAEGHGAPAKEEAAGHGEEKKEHETGHGAAEAGGHGAAPAKGSAKVQLNKIVVNVSGTMGTRYLMTSVTLVGSSKDFKDVIEENKDKLLDLASGSLSAKTIADLEKPGARNHIRSELLTLFNNSLPSPMVKEIFITDMAVQ